MVRDLGFVVSPGVHALVAVRYSNVSSLFCTISFKGLHPIIQKKRVMSQWAFTVELRTPTRISVPSVTNFWHDNSLIIDPYSYVGIR